MDEDSLVKKRNKAQRDGNFQVLADMQKKLGDLYFDKKQYEEALEAYKGQLQACNYLNNKLNCAIAHRMIGEVYAYIGNFSEALEHQNLYLETAKELEDLIEEQRAFATLGRTHLLIADSLIKETEADKKTEALKDAKKAFSKSIRLCDKLENKINVIELMTMRARLLLNLGLVVEQQKDTNQALTLIKQARALCKQHNLHEDMYRTNSALAGLNERLGNFDLAITYLDNAANVDDIYLKTETHLQKAELLLKLGEWIEAQKILRSLYKSRKLLDPIKQQVTKLLRIAILLCRTEDKLLMENNLSIKEKMYETMGDAAVAVRCLEKAVEYYKDMLACAEQTKSNQVAAALTSLAQTLRDDGRFQEAIPYARKELELCSTSKDSCNSALYLINLLIDANAPSHEICEVFQRALVSSEQTNDYGLRRLVIKDYIEYLHKMEDIDLKEIENMNEKLESLPESICDDAESENESQTQEIGADICLDDISDEEEEIFKNQQKNVSKSSSGRSRCIVKKNCKGESLLHLACIKGNLSTVEKLLNDHHPTDVRDNCGWTPLHEAANHGHVEIVQMLLRAGANVNDRGGPKCGGITAMHDAATNGHTRIVELLLDSGADANLTTEAGDSTLDCLEQWRERQGVLSPGELKEYLHAKKRLGELVTKKKTSKKKRRDPDKVAPDFSPLVDEDQAMDVTLPKFVDSWVTTASTTTAKPEKISAGEDYKRTIASMQHPLRQNLPAKPAGLPKITAPLIDSEEMLVDDWLEEDVEFYRTKEKAYFNSNGLPPTSSAVATSTTKRKSKNDSDEEIERDVDKNMKRAKNEKEPAPVLLVDEDSCESSSSEPMIESYDEFRNWPKKKKKPRQTNLLKQGFVRNTCSRPASPSAYPESIYTPSISRQEQERQSWESGSVRESLDLTIHVDEELFELKLHFRDLRKTMNDIEELIRHKFEAKTGCKPRMNFETIEGVILAAEITLEEIPTERNKLKLIGKIIQNDLPSIVDRYKKVCETLNIQVTDSMLKSLRSCDNTSLFRLNMSDNIVEELQPLIKCLRYQKNLQTLNLSGATFFDCGELLNYVISGLDGLCELHLQCCDIDFECLSKVDKFPTQIRVLDLSYNPLSGRSQRKLYELIKPLKHLQILNLKSCDLDDFKFTYSNSSLVNIDVSWNPIGGQGAANLLQRQLLALNLSNTQNFSCNRLNVIDKIFFSEAKDFSLFTLESLELSSCHATDLDVEKILSQTPNLTRIILSNNINVTKTSLCALLTRKPTMSFIDLSGCSEIDEVPDYNLKLVTPQACTLLVQMQVNVINAWEMLWQGKGHSKKLPHNLVMFKPI